MKSKVLYQKNGKGVLLCCQFVMEKLSISETGRLQVTTVHCTRTTHWQRAMEWLHQCLELPIRCPDLHSGPNISYWLVTYSLLSLANQNTGV